MSAIIDDWYCHQLGWPVSRSTMRPTTNTSSFLRGCVAAISFAIVVTACSSAPVQEMSDARQAVEAASRAGAASVAPTQMNAAKAALTMAERLLRDHQFSAARHYAQLARKRALEAQQQVPTNTVPVKPAD
jgi:hypothetical protein